MQHASGFDNNAINPRITIGVFGFTLAAGGLYSYLTNPTTPALLASLIGGGALYAIWEGYV